MCKKIKQALTICVDMYWMRSSEELIYSLEGLQDCTCFLLIRRPNFSAPQQTSPLEAPAFHVFAYSHCALTACILLAQLFRPRSFQMCLWRRIPSGSYFGKANFTDLRNMSCIDTNSSQYIEPQDKFCRCKILKRYLLLAIQCVCLF